MSKLHRHIENLEQQATRHQAQQFAAIMQRYGNDPHHLARAATHFEKQVVVDVIWPTITRLSHDVLPLLIDIFIAYLQQPQPKVEVTQLIHPAQNDGPSPPAQAIKPRGMSLLPTQLMNEMQRALQHPPTVMADDIFVALIRAYQRQRPRHPAQPQAGTLYDATRLEQYAALFERMADESLS